MENSFIRRIFCVRWCSGIGHLTKFGQSLFVRQNSEKQISWRSLDEKNEKWFFGRFDLEHLESIESNDLEIAENLVKIFAYIRQKTDPF